MVVPWHRVSFSAWADLGRLAHFQFIDLGKRCHETLISKENSFRKKREKEKHTFTSHTHVKYP